MAHPSVPKTVTLLSNDGKEFVVDTSLAIKSSQTIKGSMIGRSNAAVPLRVGVHSSVLARAIEYWKLRESSCCGYGAEGALKKWYEEQLVKMDCDQLLEMIANAEHLGYKDLVDVLYRAMADAVTNMSVEDARDYLKIENDFTKEEEEMIRNENAWAFI